jgi:hypothetical protein
LSGTEWWWTQSQQTGLCGRIPCVQGKVQGNFRLFVELEKTPSNFVRILIELRENSLTLRAGKLIHWRRELCLTILPEREPHQAANLWIPYRGSATREPASTIYNCLGRRDAFARVSRLKEMPTKWLVSKEMRVGYGSIVFKGFLTLKLTLRCARNCAKRPSVRLGRVSRLRDMPAKWLVSKECALVTRCQILDGFGGQWPLSYVSEL